MGSCFISSGLRCALLLFLVGSSWPVAAEGSGEFVLRWRERTYLWQYNPAHEPSWLKLGEALQMAQAAADSWARCGVDLRYAGLTDKPPGVMDSINVIGWQTDGKAYSAWTSWRARRNGQAIEADITLYANIFNDYRQHGIDARLELRKSIRHELGHVLGLRHSNRLGDVMTVKIRTQPEWRLPSENDLAACQVNYPPIESPF